MAPQYAPSLRSRLGPLLLLLQTGFLIIFVFYTEVDGSPSLEFYTDFQDINVMVMMGFGFTCTFLARHGFSAVGFNLLIAAMTTQWAILLNDVESWYYRGKIRVNMRSVVEAKMCTVSALISTGAVQGKTSPVHLILMALLEVSGFIFNEWFLRTLLKVWALDNSMLLHIYSTFFGLTVSWILYRKGSEQRFEKEKVDHRSGLFSLLGIVFLWVFWPSFNAMLMSWRSPWRKLELVCSSYLALAVSAVTAAAVSVLSNPKGRMNLLHLQACVLSGGVVVGVSMPVILQPWEAMVVGFAAAIISSLGFQLLQVHMLLAFQCHDTRAILSTYGLPGLLGWLTQFILLFRQCDDHTTSIRCAVFHIYTLLITIATSLSMGILTGFLLKLKIWRSPQNKKCFDDQAFWEFPHLAVHK